MKTREEIMKEYYLRWLEVDASNRAWRDAALAELDDPMARLIAAAKEALPWLSPDAKPRYARERYEALRDLRDAIDYTEQRRAQA
jgi:hypothetical protein